VPTEPTAEVYLVLQAHQLSSVDQFTDILQSAFHEHDLVQIAPPGRVRKIPPDSTWIGSGPEQPDQNSLAGRPTLS
jgi:hypothetical protein